MVWLDDRFVIVVGVVSEWADEKVESASMLKLIYHGRFLHGSVTLSALNLPQGKTTVMHLVTRENLPEPNSNGGFIVVFIYFKSNVSECVR